MNLASKSDKILGHAKCSIRYVTAWRKLFINWLRVPLVEVLMQLLLVPFAIW